MLLLGETGTGKELLAHAIHGASARANQPLVTVNVAAIPDTLLEVEFFGAAPGAYTGADRKGRVGKFELADGGTLFLDEIGDMPLPLQGKLLRVLQDKEFEPLGSNRIVRADVRIIAATSADLPALVAAGRFRADLFYRLNVLTIHAPPLARAAGGYRGAGVRDARRAVDAGARRPRHFELARRRVASVVFVLLAGQRAGIAQHAGARGDAVRQRAYRCPRARAVHRSGAGECTRNSGRSDRTTRRRAVRPQRSLFV